MDLRLNLANRPYLNRRLVWRWLLSFGVFLVLLLVVNLFYGYVNYRQFKLVESRNAELDKQLAELKGVPEDYSAESFERVKQQVVLANQILDADQFHWTALLGRLEELVPDEVSVRSIQPDFKERSLKIEASAKDVTAMTAFLDRLLASEDLNEVFLMRQAEAESKGTGQILVGFSLVIRRAF